jgi:hypothetical protein
VSPRAHRVRAIRRTLRFTSAVALLQGIGHAMLFLTAKPRHGPDETAVLETMQARAFDFGGFSPHSYWDMYFGYGLIAVVLALLIGVLLWLVSDLASSPRSVLRFGTAIGATVAVHGVIVARYFFMLPLIFDVLVLSGTLLSIGMSRRIQDMAAERAGISD